MKHFDYPQLPEELQKGLNDYCKFWEQGLKKRANAVIREIMKYYDTLSEDIHKEFISIVCTEICDNHVELFRDYSLPYEVSIRLAQELFPFVNQGVLPQARWYCELFGDLDETISTYQKNKDDFKIARVLMLRLIYLLSFGAHHFPDYSCLENVSELDKAEELGEEILKKHDIDVELQQDKSVRSCFISQKKEFRIYAGSGVLQTPECSKRAKGGAYVWVSEKSWQGEFS